MFFMTVQTLPLGKKLLIKNERRWYHLIKEKTTFKTANFLKNKIMNKTEALQRINSLEKETKELRKIIESAEKITDRVGSFEEACLITGDSPKLPFSEPANKIQERINYDYKIYVITKALNEQWELEWSNSNQAKWYPWMQYDKASSAFRFDCSLDCCSDAAAGTGVRLATKELSDCFGKKFEDLISKHLLTFQK